MKFSQLPTMADALRITRTGQIAEATALIKATLSGSLPLGLTTPNPWGMIHRIAIQAILPAKSTWPKNVPSQI